MPPLYGNIFVNNLDIIEMDYFFSDEQKLVSKIVKEFAEDHLEPVANKMDENDYWPESVFLKLGKTWNACPNS